MANNYRVTAPYVTLKVKDKRGEWGVHGFYEGAVVAESNVDPDHFKRHLDRGWLEKAEDVEPAAAEPVGTGQDPEPERPSQADNKTAWVDYAVARGIDRGEAEAMTKADLVELLK